MNFSTISESDNLNLKPFSLDKDSIDSNDDLIRNIKDENGRLMKLLHEKDFEIKRLKKECDKRQMIQSRDTGIGAADKHNLSDAASAMKIIELSKKIREISAELESVKSKFVQKSKEAEKLSSELAEIRFQSNKRPSKQSTESIDKPRESSSIDEAKQLRDKLKSSESRVLELLSANQNLSKELKISLKILEEEIGDKNIDLNKLINDGNRCSNWRGRSQQILALKLQIDSLKKEMSESRPSNGATSIGIDNRQLDHLAKLQRNRSENALQLETEHRKLQDDYAESREHCDRLKVRNTVLSTEIKSIRQQIATMLNKAKNDDELIASLIRRGEQMQSIIDQNNRMATESIRSAKIKDDPDLSIIKSDKNQLMKESDAIDGDGDSTDRLIGREHSRILSEAMQIEIDKLRRLVTVNDERYRALMDTVTALTQENSQLKQNGLQIEKEIQKLTPNVKLKSKFKTSTEHLSDSRLATLLSADVSVSRETISELQEIISLQIDKIESLKNALQLMSSAKKEDVSILTNIIDETRNKFVDTVKRLKSNVVENQS